MQVNCENCSNYVYNEEYEYYECLTNMDEDDYVKFLSGSFRECPYFQLNDEYRIVRKQI